MTQELTTKYGILPAHLVGQPKERFGNIDSSDLVIPRVKLLSAVSSEVTDYENARAGDFWHTVLLESLGRRLVGVPIVVHKTYVLWPPRDDGRSILARSRDGIHWDPPEGEFDIQFKGNQTVYKWKLAPTVIESGLHRFGSSRDDDPDSQPAATLTYEILWWFPERHELTQPAIILNARGSVKVCQNLISAIEDKPTSSYNQKYSIESVVAKGPAGQNFFNYSYTGLGYTNDEESEFAKTLYRRFQNVAFRASDEIDDSAGAPKGASQRPHQTMNRSPDSKF